MSNNIKYLIGFISLALIVIFFLKFDENRSYKLRGNKLIEEVESFRKHKGKLPTSIEELNRTNEMSIGPYYNLENDSTYIIYFNLGFDYSLVYSSSLEKWEEKP